MEPLFSNIQVSTPNTRARSRFDYWRICDGCGKRITRDETGLWYNRWFGHYCPRTDVTQDVYYTAILRCSTLHAPKWIPAHAQQ